MTSSRTTTSTGHNAPRRLKRRPRRLAVSVCLVGLGVLGLLSFTPARFIAIHMAGTVSDNFVTYRLMSERDALLAANDRLEKELQVLKARGIAQTGSSFEASVRSQLDELQAVIAAQSSRLLHPSRVQKQSSQVPKKTSE